MRTFKIHNQNSLITLEAALYAAGLAHTALKDVPPQYHPSKCLFKCLMGDRNQQQWHELIEMPCAC